MLGCITEFAIWYPVNAVNSNPYTAGSYALLDRLQAPGVSVAYFVAWLVVKVFNPKFLLLPAYIGSACGFAVLIALWSGVALSAILLAKHLLPEKE
jgi:hypothetical protein